MFSKNHIAAIALIGSTVAIRREPLLTWSATVPATHPMNYPVPDFGVDHEIAASLKHSAAWEPTKDKDDKWIVPDAAIEFKLLQTDEMVNRDPLLTAKGNRRELVHQKPAYDGQNIDYFVPNFGVDRDIKDSLSNSAKSEKRLKHKFSASWDNKDGKDVRDYFVPNFGVDEDIKATRNSAKVAEKSTGNKWVVPEKGYPTSWGAVQLDEQVERDPLLTAKSNRRELVHQKPAYDGQNIDYFVPNFGVDQDIKDSISNSAKTEKRMNYKWTANWDNKDGKDVRDYFVPNFGVDEDIKATRNSAKVAEKSTGIKWVVPEKGYVPSWGAVQLDEETEREPLLASKFNRKELVHQKPAYDGMNIDYFVPNFGVDHDIKATTQNIASSEKKLKKKLNASFENKKAPVNPRDYFVPNFGIDRDITDSLSNLKKQEKKHGKWTLPKE